MHTSKQCGFNPIGNWPTMFYHLELQLMLMVYVDDFKNAWPCQDVG